MLYRELKEGRKTLHAAHWGSIDELAREEVPAINLKHFQERVVERTDGAEWFGIEGGWPAVQKTVADGWTDGMQRGAMLGDSVALPRIQSVRRRKVRKEFGDFVDMQRVYSGDLSRAWESSVREMPPQSAGANCTLVTDVCAAWNQPAEELFWNGATACAIIRALQASGRNVQVICCFKNEQNTGIHFTSVCVKKYSQPLNLSALFACTALGGWLRGYMFKADNCIPVPTQRGYGIAVHDRKASPLWPRTDFTVWVQQCWNRGKAEAALKNVASLVQDSRRNPSVKAGD